jgi:hypothetical protein
MFRGLLDNGLLYHKFDNTVGDGRGLGRNLWLDARSLDFMVENSPEDMSRPLYNQEWERVLVILNQGSLQSCTGNAGIGALGTQPFYGAAGREVLPPPNNRRLAERLAIQLYADSTELMAFREYSHSRTTVPRALPSARSSSPVEPYRGTAGHVRHLACCNCSRMGQCCRACLGIVRSTSQIMTASLIHGDFGQRVEWTVATRWWRSGSNSTVRIP